MDKTLDSFSGHPIYFKHIYGRGVKQWGVVGLPKTQPATAAARLYSLGAPVLLAVPYKPQPVLEELADGIKGKIFALCTLAKIGDTRTRELANPAMVAKLPAVADRWGTALPVVKAWYFDEPVDYSRFGGGALLDLARRRRGQLIRLKGLTVITELRTWMSYAPRREVAITHSRRVADYLAVLT